MLKNTLVPLLASVALALPAFTAQDPGQDALNRARKLMEEGQQREAATAFGRAVALAQKAQDLGAEQTAVGALFEAKGLMASSDALALIMAELDPARGGAFLSAHLLAEQILRLDTRTGALEHVGEAATVLTRRARSRGCGDYAKSLALYGRGMAELSADDAEAAGKLLLQCLKSCEGEQWFALSIYAGTEACAVFLAADDVESALKCTSRIGAMFDEGTDPYFVRSWRVLVEARLEDAPSKVLAPYEKSMQLFKKTAPAAAGAGGTGGIAQGPTAFAAAIEKHKAKKPLVTVQRGKTGLEIEFGFGDRHQAVEPFEHRVAHHVHGGVILCLHGPAVAMLRLDWKTGAAAPGTDAGPSPRRAWYVLAKKETWQLMKTGEVLVR